MHIPCASLIFRIAQESRVARLVAIHSPLSFFFFFAGCWLSLSLSEICATVAGSLCVWLTACRLWWLAVAGRPPAAPTASPLQRRVCTDSQQRLPTHRPASSHQPTAVAMPSPCMEVAAKVRRDGRTTLGDGRSDERRRSLSQPVDDRRRPAIAPRWLSVASIRPDPLTLHRYDATRVAPACLHQPALPSSSHPLTYTSLTVVVSRRPSTALRPSTPPSALAAMSLGSAAAGGVASKKTPSDFLKSVLGRPVIVKLNSGVSYRGVLACLDGHFTRPTAQGQRVAVHTAVERAD